MHILPIVTEYLSSPDIQARLALADSSDTQIALAKEVHGHLPFAIGVVIKQDFVAEVLDQATVAK